MQWFGSTLQCVERVPPEERAEFDKWDCERPEGVGTSGWPSFARRVRAPLWESIH